MSPFKFNPVKRWAAGSRHVTRINVASVYISSFGRPLIFLELLVAHSRQKCARSRCESNARRVHVSYCDRNREKETAKRQYRLYDGFAIEPWHECVWRVQPGTGSAESDRERDMSAGRVRFREVQVAVKLAENRSYSCRARWLSFETEYRDVKGASGLMVKDWENARADTRVQSGALTESRPTRFDWKANFSKSS